MTGYDRFDLLRAWNTFQELDENPVPQMPEPLRLGGLDLAERVDSAVLYSATWDGKHLDEEGLAIWQRLKTPVIAEQTRKIHNKAPFDRIGFDETGGGIVASSFFSDLPMEGVQLTQNRKDDAVNCVKYLFDAKILRVQNRQLITELLEQEKITGKGTGRPRYRHQNGRHDDAFWGCAIMCYIAVPYLVGIPPAAIEATQDIESNDPDTILRDVMKPYTKSAYGTPWA